MATNQPARWSPTFGRVLAIAALILFILSALSFAGYMSANAHFLLVLGLICLAAEGVW